MKRKSSVKKRQTEQQQQNTWNTGLKEDVA